MKCFSVPINIDRKAKVDYSFQELYKPTFKIIGNHKFVRISSLTDEEINILHKGYNKSRIISELDTTDKGLEKLTLPIHEVHPFHDKFEFVSYLGLPTLFIEKGPIKLMTLSVKEFLYTKGFKEYEVDGEFQVYYDSIRG
jgi:hypothetical protein